MKKDKTKEIKILSKCCSDEVEFIDGGYDGEDIVPVRQICKKCRMDCDVKVIKPKGWVQPIIPF